MENVHSLLLPLQNGTNFLLTSKKHPPLTVLRKSWKRIFTRNVLAKFRLYLKIGILCIFMYLWLTVILFTVFHYFCDICLFMLIFYDNMCKCLFILYVSIFCTVHWTLWDIRTLNKFITIIIIIYYYLHITGTSHRKTRHFLL